MKMQIAIAIVLSFMLGATAGPPDLTTHFIWGVSALLLCAVVLMIMFSTQVVKQASIAIKRLIVILVVCLSIMTVHWLSALLIINDLKAYLNK